MVSEILYAPVVIGLTDDFLTACLFLKSEGSETKASASDGRIVIGLTTGPQR